MTDRWSNAIIACEECKLRYPQIGDGTCPIHGTPFTVAFPPAELPEQITVRKCPDCGSESDKSLTSNTGKMSPNGQMFVTNVPHCPDCGSVRQGILVEERELTDAEVQVLTTNAEHRAVAYEVLSNFDETEV